HGDRPLRGARFRLVMRVVVVLGLVGLIVPGILVAAGTANATAQRTCAVYTNYFAPDAVNFSTRFELFSPAGMGWNCYAISFGGKQVLVASLGLIPGGARLPSAPLERS
ncbi:MAG: hypothetical protein Q8M65_08895, partial [Rhodoglobus sp.]|nr:hypothetical protein [Rhodoglobus sp.]